MMKKKISVIIPSFNSGWTIEHTFRALDTQTRKDLIAEIIIVDSSTDKETKKILSGYESGKIRVVNAGVRIMPAIGRNIGATYASGEILAFIDADAYPAHDWLEHIVIAREEGRMVGGGSISLSDLQKNKPIALAQYYLQFNEYKPVGSDRIKKFVVGCNMFCDKELFRKTGGFPEIRAGEEVMFGLKISKVAELWFIPEAKVYHIFRESWKEFLKNQVLLGKYACIYRREYYDNFIYKGIMPLILFPGFLCIKLFRISSRISKAGRCHVYRFIMSLPVFLIGLLFWSIGFMKGCLISSEDPKY